MAKQSKNSGKSTVPETHSFKRNIHQNSRIVENGYVAIKNCRDGLMMYNLNDLFISRSLDVYGEWCYAETALLGQLLKSGDVVLDVGANIGTHTVFFGKKVSPGGLVYAFEPQRVTFEFLCSNIVLNGLVNVIPLQKGASDQPGEVNIPILNPAIAQNFGGMHIEGHENGDKVSIIPLDDLNLERCNLIKIDVEGMELKVLQGAKKTIQKCHPFLFIENNGREGAPDLVKAISDMNYSCWWQIATYFNPDNYFKNPENIWPNIAPEANMICASNEINFNINGFEKVISPEDSWIQAIGRIRSRIAKQQ